MKDWQFYYFAAQLWLLAGLGAVALWRRHPLIGGIAVGCGALFVYMMARAQIAYE